MATERTKLVKDADKWFSHYIRNRDNGECFCCGIQKPVKEMQNGHLITRGKYSVRWDEQNAFCQCPGCNIRHEHQPEIMTSKYIDRFTVENYQELVSKSNQIVKYTKSDLVLIAKEYKQKLAELSESGYTD